MAIHLPLYYTIGIYMSKKKISYSKDKKVLKQAGVMHNIKLLISLLYGIISYHSRDITIYCGACFSTFYNVPVLVENYY